MDFNRNLRIVRTSGSSYPFQYKSNVLWVHHDENNNPIIEIWDHGKWVPVTVVGSGSGNIIIDTKMSDSSSNAIANKTVKKYIDGIASKTDASILSLNEGKVDKEQGKGLSTNDYTDLDKERLNKMPTKVSDLENDSKYATDQDLVNLATKDELKRLDDKITYIDVPELVNDYIVQANEFHKETVYTIEVGETIHAIVGDSTIKWMNGEAPVTQADHIYVVSVIGPLAVWGEFPKA